MIFILTKKNIYFKIYKIGFISRNEFADVIKLILHGENDTGDDNEAYIEELSSAMDFDKNGKIDVNEFLESFRIVYVKTPNNQTGKSQKSNENLKRNSSDLNGRASNNKARV